MHDGQCDEKDNVCMATLDAPGLAKLLHLSVATIRADVSRRPWTLPPAVKVGTGTKTIWLYSTVIQWLKDREKSPSRPAEPGDMKKGRPRGRPSKADVVKGMAGKEK